MNGIHDLGGMHGFGPVVREENEPVFHEPWEGQICAINRAVQAQGLFNLDEFRHGIERMDPARYLLSSYYERWLASVERNLVEKGILAVEEIDARTAALLEHPDAPRSDRQDPAIVEQALRRFSRRPSHERPGPSPRFAVGDRVLTCNTHPAGHTRLPRYARGKRGTVVAAHGCHVFPDTHAHGLGEQPQPLYTVRFSAAELWGDSSESAEQVHVDLWESYLRPDDA